MKKLILLITIIFSTTAFSQIKTLNVSQVKKIGSVQFLDLNQNNDEITFSYLDLLTNEKKKFSFLNKNNDLENLYTAIISGFDNIPTSDIALELPNDIVYLHFEKSMGVVNFQFLHAPNKDLSVISKSVYLTKKKILKLFGKS